MEQACAQRLHVDGAINSCPRSLQDSIELFVNAAHANPFSASNNIMLQDLKDSSDTSQFFKEEGVDTSAKKNRQTIEYQKAVQSCHQAFKEECTSMRKIVRQVIPPEESTPARKDDKTLQSEEKATELALFKIAKMFIKNLCKDSVAVYQEQKRVAPEEEVKDKVLVPFHVYFSIIRNPEQYDFLTNNFKTFASTSNDAMEEQDADEEMYEPIEPSDMALSSEAPHLYGSDLNTSAMDDDIIWKSAYRETGFTLEKSNT